jgi:hypothetical protein
MCRRPCSPSGNVICYCLLFFFLPPFSVLIFPIQRNPVSRADLDNVILRAASPIRASTLDNTDTPPRHGRVRVSNANPVYGLVEGAKRGNEIFG